MATAALAPTNNMSQSLGINKSSELNLNRLVNLALNSSPKVGIVNFNILKTFLLELLKALNLQNFEPKFGDDHETRHLLEDAIQNESQHDSLLSLIQDKNTSEAKPSNSQDDISKKHGISILTSDMKPLTLERFHTLEDKLSRFEQQIAALNTLPSNQQIIDKSKEIKRNASASGPILEIWQYTQLSKRLESNEEGITKLTSLLQDLIGEINDLKDGQSKNNNELKELNEKYLSLIDRFNEFDKFKKNLPSLDQLKNLEDDIQKLKNSLGKIEKLDELFKHMENELREIEKKLVFMVKYSDLETYVQWPQLENAINGMKEALDSATSSVQARLIPIVSPRSSISNKIVEQQEKKQTYTQTSPSPMPALVPIPISRPGSASPLHPSKELKEILAKLGTLNERHENLVDEVERLKLELAKKQKDSGSSVKLPEDFMQKMEEIKKIKAALEELLQNFNSETNKRMKLEEMIANLNKELENIKNSIKELLKNTNLNSEDILNLKMALTQLEDKKADKNWVRSEFERKADKKDLDIKVNQKNFDETNHDLSHTINNCIQKNALLEDEWKKGTENIFKELESKLDRLELDSLKDYIEKQLKKLKKLQKESTSNAQSMLPISQEDEAAGLRKQLLRFHCISCDRPIELSQQGSVPSLPAERGMRPIQTPRPYTTYELDQIRTFQKQQFLPDHGYDLFSTVRQCGGSHTLTVPHKKLLKIPQALTEERTASPIGGTSTNPRSEVQIQGQDGIIYKGRIDAKLSVDMKKSVKNSNPFINNTTSSNPNLNTGMRPVSSTYPHIKSATTKHEDKVDGDSSEKLPIFTNS